MLLTECSIRQCRAAISEFEIRAAVQSVPTYEADHFAEGSTGDRDDERARHTVECVMALG